MEGVSDANNYDYYFNDNREQDYLGYTLTFYKRLSNKWMLRGNFSWADWEWSVPNVAVADPNVYRGASNVDGQTVLDQSTGSGKADIFLSPGWSYSLTGMYQIAPDRAWGFNVSAALNGREGYALPYYGEITRIPGTADGSGSGDLLATKNNDSISLDDSHMLDLRIEKEVNISDFGLTFGVEVFNAFNDGTVLQREAKLTSSRADYVTEVTSPRVFRGTVRFSFN